MSQLTRNRNEELDGVPVTVERELRLAHVAVRHEGLRGQGLVGLRPEYPHRPAGHDGGLLPHGVGDLLGRLGGLGDRGRVVEGHGDDDAVAGAHPEAEVGDEQGGDADEAEAELAGACTISHFGEKNDEFLEFLDFGKCFSWHVLNFQSPRKCKVQINVISGW